VAGATAYAEDVREAAVHRLDAGHCVLAEAAPQVVELIGSFWTRRCFSIDGPDWRGPWDV
jgi:hypothetical protein